MTLPGFRRRSEWESITRYSEWRLVVRDVRAVTNPQRKAK